jgi:hypothetical protein
MAGSEYYEDPFDDVYNEKLKQKYASMSPVSTPKHYDNEVQPWDYMRQIMTPDEFEGFLRGNVIKYVSRYKDKNGKQDIIKAKHYLEKMLEIM